MPLASVCSPDRKTATRRLSSLPSSSLSSSLSLSPLVATRLTILSLLVLFIIDDQQPNQKQHHPWRALVQARTMAGGETISDQEKASNNNNNPASLVQANSAEIFYDALGDHIMSDRNLSSWNWKPGDDGRSGSEDDDFNDFDEDDDEEDFVLRDSDGDVRMRDHEETFYDADDEIYYDEVSEENTCATASQITCHKCCMRQAFYNPFWDKTVGQCFCYNTVYEENICKKSKSNDDCSECCTNRRYKLASFDGSGKPKSSCICSLVDEEFYKHSFD